MELLSWVPLYASLTVEALASSAFNEYQDSHLRMGFPFGRRHDLDGQSGFWRSHDTCFSDYGRGLRSALRFRAGIRHRQPDRLSEPKGCNFYTISYADSSVCDTVPPARYYADSGFFDPRHE